MLLGALSAGTTTFSFLWRILNTDVAFVLIDLLSFLIRIWINDLTALTHSQSVSTSFFSLCPFSGIVLHLFHKKFEIAFPIYVLWLTIFWTLSKNFKELLIIYDAQIPRNDVRMTICEWWIVPITIRRLNFEAINAEVLQYTSII